ncbi:putative alcohol dehydrogenase [Thelonectria olida]|uniref:Alcohol dehydrogenase n=1 Tax=Thelonectria olida TaxID=1576542 RepID=A0A9P9AL95_9HYPO|nr:putative alcohol dehydrogenase [Thelonectria olida]
MAPTQKALLITEVGKPAVLVNDRAVPEPGPNQVQIKVTVAGLNPHDWKSRDTGLFISQSLPAVLANDVVGKVTKVGEGVADITVGDRIVSQAVFAPGSLQNGLQEYALAAVGSMAKIPDSITDDEAATLPTNIIAPLVALFKVLEIPAPWSPTAGDFDYANASILIVGGGSNCGKFGVQLARLAGIGRIVVVGGNETELKGFGATHVIDRHGGFDAVLGRVKKVVGDDLVYAFDPVNPPDGQILALNALSNHKKGALARLLPLGPVDESKVLGKKAGFDVRNVFGSSQAHPELAGQFWGLVPEYLQTKKLKPLTYAVHEGLEASHVNAVLDAYRDGKPVIKTHLHL